VSKAANANHPRLVVAGLDPVADRAIAADWEAPLAMSAPAA
jgi:hypothetical protein